MKYSVVIPVLNVLDSISCCIHSLPPASDSLEYVIVDNGSTDGTLSYLEKKLDDNNGFRIIHCMEKGISYALNCGVKAAKHENIIRMDGDDIMFTSRINILIDGYEKYWHPLLVMGSDMVTIDTSGKIKSYVSFPRTHRGAEARFCRGTPVAHPTVVYTKYLFELVGGYPNRTSPSEDYAFWLRARAHGAKFRSLPTPLLYYRIHDKNASHLYAATKKLVVINERRRFLMRDYEPNVLDEIYKNLTSKQPTPLCCYLIHRQLRSLKSKAAVAELISTGINAIKIGELKSAWIVLLLIAAATPSLFPHSSMLILETMYTRIRDLILFRLWRMRAVTLPPNIYL
jgi:glycosyltransferase involved in cell wall biosynthesis